MTIIRGNILDFNVNGYLLHQVNAEGKAGAGLALALRLKYPEAFYSYRDFCQSFREHSLGKYVMGGRNPRIVHIVGQLKPGPHTDYNAAEIAIEEFSRHNVRRLPVAVPWKMGCGLGGGDWEVYQQILEQHLPNALIYRL
jgi:hypothetical protein